MIVGQRDAVGKRIRRADRGEGESATGRHREGDGRTYRDRLRRIARDARCDGRAVRDLLHLV